jgi:pimeloyl-ACP methyl ester carboxylesterase
METHDSLQMPAEVRGSGAVPVVLVPGGLTGWLSWERHAARLAEKRRVVRVQLVSVQYGLEGRALPGDYTLRTESRALAATLQALALGNEPLDLVAWSYGAAIALDYALDHPQGIRTLTLIEPPALWALGADRPVGAEYEALEAVAAAIGDKVEAEQLEQFLHAVGLVPVGTRATEMPQWPVWLQHRQSLRNTRAPLQHRDDPARLRALPAPVLLVKGTGSAPFLHQIIAALAAGLPQAEVLELPGGHAPQIAAAERFMAALERFMDRSLRAAA